MDIGINICKKFPLALKEKLLNKEIELPDGTQIKYDKILVYRAVARSADDNHEVTLDDFKSYFELGKVPVTPKKKPRGVPKDYMHDPKYYGVSSFTNREIVEQKMKMPNPHKKMICGYVHQDGGPQKTDEEHICWWLFQSADVSGFKLIKD